MPDAIPVPPLPQLDTRRLTLRACTPTDAPTIQRLLDDAEVAAGTLRIPHPYPPGAAAEWIGRHPTWWAEGRTAAWAMVERASGGIVGAITLKLARAHRRAEAGYWVARARWGEGFATESLRAVIAVGFDRLDLHRIEAHCYAENAASARVIEKAGMRFEGLVRGAVWRDGVPRDLRLYGILRSDPRA